MNARPDSREFEYWMPQPLFDGATVFCLASGPSLTREVCDKVRGRGRAIVVNSSHSLAPWSDVLFFTDGSWYEPRRQIVAEWAGLVISMSRTAKCELPDKVHRVRGEFMPGFAPRGHAAILQGRSSGHTAVSLAVSLGARRVVLLGYDMRVVDGREHHHDEYDGPRDLDQYAAEFVPAFASWNRWARAIGIEIVNATAGSAITEFPFVDLDDELLACAAS